MVSSGESVIGVPKGRSSEEEEGCVVFESFSFVDMIEFGFLSMSRKNHHPEEEKRAATSSVVKGSYDVVVLIWPGSSGGQNQFVTSFPVLI